MKFASRLPALHWSHTPIGRVLRPMQEFVGRSESSGIILLFVTVLALLLANSPLAGAYNALLETKAGIAIGPFTLEETLLHWVNDGLMVVFFFVIGLELKREVLAGELSDVRAAALPIAAAVGGVAVPAAIFALVNAGGAGAAGWGIPMATDIAFALGLLALLGDRVPFALKIFLTAVAIVDDLIAVLVIALFYSGGVSFGALGLGLGVLALLVVANRWGVRSPLVYAALGVVVWLAFLKSGVHATIAGVLLALTIPARYRIDAPTFLDRARRILRDFEQSGQDESLMLTDERQQSAVIALEEACEHVQAPLQKLEHALHPWVALLIMPVFALANAGVSLAPAGLGSASLPLILCIVAGLVLGKPLGLLGACWLATRTGIATLPAGVSWRHMLGVGILAGVGFTMSLFIAALAFADPATLIAAKLGVLAASLVAGISGVLVLSRVLPAERLAEVAD
ncbi:MAG: Na+/H+ antiporter NhaA [Chloroflexales bacterium]|nr:Na+/H+ antiporter NhaA [Chloroflexales bacterium]